MKTIGNIIWVVFGGLISAIVLLFEAAFWCITIIGIPIGVKLFQLASFVIWPFGKKVAKVKPSGLKTVLNVIWAILFGWINALLYCLIGLLYCINHRDPLRAAILQDRPLRLDPTRLRLR